MSLETAHRIRERRRPSIRALRPHYGGDRDRRGRRSRRIVGGVMVGRLARHPRTGGGSPVCKRTRDAARRLHWDVLRLYREIMKACDAPRAGTELSSVGWTDGVSITAC